MTNKGIIGSGKYTNKKVVLLFLEQNIDKDKDTIISGRSPRNNYNNVDIWAEEWAYEFCTNKPIIHTPKQHNKNGYFLRNGLIARDSDELHSFINKGQLISGAWNTINQFIKLISYNYTKLFVYNQFGIKWSESELPNWITSNYKIIPKELI